ncbi:helix-turn-helix domain-containing protein [Sphingobium sp. BYY-5]|uniref:helix-turn-helix transcriptional regulator n=1 Tax=Sphingobium sp. BYY-5 TaxID=2926400 RepID=UPI001FA7C53E|nr:helix-turn-helix domain-containing protein [Sphingobium sp. BYY-5]
MASPAYLTVEEVIERYRGTITEGTLRNWRSMRIGPSFLKLGRAVLYPVAELDQWDRSNLVLCKRVKSLPLEEANAEARGRSMEAASA